MCTRVYLLYLCKDHHHYRGWITNTYKVLSVFEGVITLESELGVFLVIAEKSSLLDLLEPGRSILADKRFDVGDLLCQHDTILIVSSFLGRREQLNRHEVEET